MLQQLIKILFLILVCLATLINRPILGLNSYIVILTGLFAFIGLICKKQSEIRIRTIDILFLIVILYSQFNQKRVNLDLTIQYLSMVAVWFYIKTLDSSKFNKFILHAVILAATIHSIVACLQSFGMLSNNNYYYSTTGLFNNPGHLGCILSFAFSAFLPYVIINYKILTRKHKIIALFIWGLLLTGIVLADSRAAYLAIIVSTTTFYFIKQHNKIQKSVIHIGFAVVLMSCIVLLMYMYRPSSANARLNIWKICIHSIKEAPIFGHGTGDFRKTYMLKQADFLSNACEEIRRNADEVKTAFNLPLELLYEQGIIGLLLWCSIIGISIKNKLNDNNDPNAQLLLFPIISFLIFSLFSYPHLIWGLLCPFIILISIGGGKDVFLVLHGKILNKVFLCTEITIFTILLLLSILTVSIDRKLTKYSTFELDSKDFESKNLTNILLYYYPSLLSIYVENQIATKDYNAAIPTITQLKQYRNSFQIERDLAYSYELVGDTIKALEHYDIAHKMCPGYLEPLLSKFLIYESKNDSLAITLAKEIIDFTHKITNSRTDAMKSRVALFLDTGTIGL